MASSPYKAHLVLVMNMQGEIASKEVFTMDALYYLGLLVPILLVVYHFTANRRNQHKNLPPGPPSIPIIGHLLLLKMPIEQAANNLSKTYGPIFLLRLGSRSTVVLSSRAAIEECFANNDVIFSNRPLLPSRKIFEYDYSTLGAPYGSHWRNIRRFSVIEIFSEKRLQISSEVLIKEIKFLIKQLYNISSEGIKKIEVRIFCYSLTFNIVTRMVAGKRCFEDEEIDSEKTKSMIYDLVEMFSPLVPVVLGDYFPYLRWLTFCGEERKQLKTHKKKDAFIQALLDAHQNTSSITSADRRQTNRTIIDVMLKLQESEPEFYTNDVVKGVIQGMFIAGTHSTTSTMELVVSQLISHLDVFQKARDEIDNRVGDSRLISDADLAELPYLHCIINETLRLSPGEVLPLRESSEDCTVGGYHIPQGTQLLVNLRAVHRDPELWTEPDRFKPERFLDREEEKGRIKFISFGLGRRACPGQGLGMRVIALSLGILIQCFDWEESQGPLNKPEKQCLEIVFRPRKTLTKVLAQL